MSTHDRASPRGSPIASLAPGPPSPARRVQNDLAVLDTFQALLLELESEFKREAQQQSWEQCRDHWRRRVSLLSTYAPDVPEQLARILLDLEASIRIEAQHTSWIDGDRNAWTAAVKDMGRRLGGDGVPSAWWVFRAPTFLSKLYDSVQRTAFRNHNLYSTGEAQRWPATSLGVAWRLSLARLTGDATDPDAAARAFASNDAWPPAAAAASAAAAVDRPTRLSGSLPRAAGDAPRARTRRPSNELARERGERENDIARFARLLDAGDQPLRSRRRADRPAPAFDGDPRDSRARARRRDDDEEAEFRDDPHYVALVQHYRRGLQSGEVYSGNWERESRREDPERDALVEAAVASVTRRREARGGGEADARTAARSPSPRPRRASTIVGSRRVPPPRRAEEEAEDDSAIEEAIETFDSEAEDDSAIEEAIETFDDDDDGLADSPDSSSSLERRAGIERVERATQVPLVDSLQVRLDRALALAESAREETLCQICFSNKRDELILPCCHMLYCHQCVVRACDADAARGQAERCPCCRGSIGGLLRCKLAGDA